MNPIVWVCLFQRGRCY